MHALRFDQAENFLGIETLDHDVLSAQQSKEMRHAPAIGVEERDGVEFDVSIFHLERQADVQSVKVHISVGEHHALGIGAGAAGIEKLGQSVFVDRGDVGAIRCRCIEKSFVVASGQPGRFGIAIQLVNCFYRGNIVSKGIGQAQKLLFHEKDGRPGIIQNVTQLARGEPDVQRQQNGAGLQNAVIRFQQAVTIAAEKCHSITGLDASLAQGTGQAADPLAEFSVRISEFIADNRGPAGELLLGVSQETQRREWNIHGVPHPEKKE